MANVALVTGLSTVISNLRSQQHRMGIGVSQGLRRAGLMLQRASQQLVPVEYGVLKASAYTRSVGSSFSTVVFVGYTSNYAIFVHENVAMAGKGHPRPSGRGNYWDPAGRGQAKFLEQPARELSPAMRKHILDSARIF